MTIAIKKNDKVQFSNNAVSCIGTGRMNLALRHEYHNQLEKVQNEIGFRYIRGHGLFCDDMGIYNRYEENGVQKTEYNFSYVDLVFDDYLSLGLKPYIELGFMPQALATGDQTIFWWKGNTTPPADYDEWGRLIKATVNHWIDRYGIDEVITWPMEVWNEPNLMGFWKNADMDEYFKLYEVSAKAVKDCDPRIRVGGPAICGVDDERWLRLFLEFCSENNVPLDFVTRHCYATELPEHVGHYAYQKLHHLRYIPDELDVSRGIIDSFPAYKGMEMHITEYNTSYTPRNPVHDTNQNAAYIAYLLSVMGDTCSHYSYWTFGDVFEEQGIAFTPFSGGFGLLTNGMIPKPTYWTYVFFSKLTSNALARGESYVVTQDCGTGKLQGVAWNVHGVPLSETEAQTDGGSVSAEKSGEGSVMAKDVPICGAAENSVLNLRFDIELDNGDYLVVKKLVDETVCNPLKSWIDMGSPSYPSAEQLALLRECAIPQVSTRRVVVENGTLVLNLSLEANAVCYFEIIAVKPEIDRGFVRERI